MTMRDVAELIDEAIFMLGNAMGCTDEIDVKEYVDEAIKHLEQAREAIEEVASDIDSAFLILKPNREV
ncbi:MAG: hypothetical protein GX457_18045 [Thermotogaceae bacterium]|nr:hypothetical protein [Thermotogaceae bacterium]